MMPRSLSRPAGRSRLHVLRLVPIVVLGFASLGLTLPTTTWSGQTVAERASHSSAATGPDVSTGPDLTDQQVLEILESRQARDRAIDRALAFLRKQQQPDGGFGTQRQHRAAMTSFAIMAHLAAGVTFDHPQHGPALRRGLAFVLSHQDNDGYLGGRDDSRMYGHGVSTLMLAEALGMVEDESLEEQVREALSRAVGVIINAQAVQKDRQHAGGWRYQPDARDSDLSLSGWQLMSLHAAQQVGISIPKSVIDRASDYTERMIDRQTGAVGYQRAGEDRPALRGLGLLSLAIARKEGSPTAAKVVERIERDPLRWGGKWFYYRVYYDAVGLSRAAPQAWARQRVRVEELLTTRQQADGSWPAPPDNNESDHGPIYMTSMAALALAVERHVLPAYQR